jgi:hypothetical protein
MTDGRTDEQRLTAIFQRLKARLPGVDLRGIAVDEETVSVTVGIDVEAARAAGVTLTSDTDEIRIVRRVWDEGDTKVVAAFCSLYPDALNELVLAQDLAVVLNGHTLNVAETQRGVTATPRERLDPSQPYSEAEAEADVERVARVLMAEYGAGVDSEREVPETHDPKPRAAEMRNASAWRREAALILSKVKGWQRGAPPSSPGHHRARGIFEGGEG